MLGLYTPDLVGEDVYALQTALNAAGCSAGAVDGDLGPKTASAIRLFQQHEMLEIDGIAGGDTQKALALRLASYSSGKFAVPTDALKGQLEYESGFRLGNYSPLRSDGTYDAGVAQRNTKFVASQEGFNAPKSVDALASNARQFYDLFAGVLPTKRRWGLAMGAWNAPAYACYIARREGATKVKASQTALPSPEATVTFETYVQHVSAYLS